jgi:hypothetical protein
MKNLIRKILKESEFDWAEDIPEIPQWYLDWVDLHAHRYGYDVKWFTDTSNVGSNARVTFPDEVLSNKAIDPKHTRHIQDFRNVFIDQPVQNYGVDEELVKSWFSHIFK